MSVIQLTASPTHWVSEFSGYGGVGWWPGPYTNLTEGQGSGWVIWAIGASGIPSSEVVNAVVATGKCSFKIGNGSGVSRNATLYCKLTNNYASIPGSSGGVVGTYPPSGASLDTTCNSSGSGITGNDLTLGNVFFCIAASNGPQDSGQQGTFSYGALTLTVYTGADKPNPPSTQPSGKWNNPAANNDPGVYPGQSFASANYRLTQPLPQTFFDQQFQIFGAPSNSIVFASTGTSSSPRYNKGTGGTDPTHPYDSDTGVIQTVSTVPPGIYSLRCTSSSGLGLNNFFDYSTITVRQRPSSGIYLMEF